MEPALVILALLAGPLVWAWIEKSKLGGLFADGVALLAFLAIVVACGVIGVVVLTAVFGQAAILR